MGILQLLTEMLLKDTGNIKERAATCLSHFSQEETKKKNWKKKKNETIYSNKIIGFIHFWDYSWLIGVDYKYIPTQIKL